MKHEILTSQGRPFVQGFGKFRQKYQHWWVEKEEKYGSVIYGALAMVAIILFGLVFYLLRGMVQFI